MSSRQKVSKAFLVHLYGEPLLYSTENLIKNLKLSRDMVLTHAHSLHLSFLLQEMQLPTPLQLLLQVRELLQ